MDARMIEVRRLLAELRADGVQIDLSETDLTGANLFMANLTGAS